MLMRRSMIVAVSLIGAATLLLIAIAFAQVPVAPKPEPVPVVSEVEALRLDRAVLILENLQLQVRAATLELQALIKSAEKPGFTIARQPDGAWVYQKVEPAKAMKPPRE